MQQTSLRFSIGTGLVAGVVLSGLAYVDIFFGPWNLRTTTGIGVPGVALLYLAGGLIGGMIYWFTQPLLARGHAGRGLVGFLSYAPMGVALGLTTVPGAMMTPEQRIVMGLVMAVLFGGGIFMVDR